MPRTPKVFTIDDPIFKTEPLFVVGCSHAEMAAYLKKRFGVPVDSGKGQWAGQMLTFSVAPWRVVWIADRGNAGLPTALHEIFHLVTRICQDKGVPIVAHHPNWDNGDETAAYLFEYFARAVLRQWGIRGVTRD